MKTILLFLKHLALAVVLCASGAARADITVFTDHAGFAAAVSSSQLIGTFNDLPVGLYVSALPLVRSIGRVSSAGNFSGTDGGGGDMWLTSTQAGLDVSFWNLPARYSPAGGGAVGGNFFATDEDGHVAAGSLDVTLLSSTQGSKTVRLVNPTADTFLGFVTSAADIVQISVRPVEDMLHASANNFTLAAAARAGNVCHAAGRPVPHRLRRAWPQTTHRF